MGTLDGAVARPPRTPLEDDTLNGKLAIGEGPTRSETEILVDYLRLQILGAGALK